MTRTRRAARRRAARDGGIPLYAQELQTIRGRCLARRGRSRTPCGNRWAVVRVSIDFTSRASIDRLATVECAECGHVWRRTRVPAMAVGGYQSVRLSLILPSESRRWFARGRWHKSGEDAVVVRDATLGDLMAAQDDWRERNGTYEAARARAAAKRQAEDAEAHARTVALLARLAEMDAERAAAEAAAID